MSDADEVVTQRRKKQKDASLAPNGAPSTPTKGESSKHHSASASTSPQSSKKIKKHRKEQSGGESGGSAAVSAQPNPPTNAGTSG